MVSAYHHPQGQDRTPAQFNHCALTRACASAVLVFGSVCWSSAAAAKNPFSNFYGTWGGSGSAIFSKGSRESLRCTAYYTGKAPTLKLAIRCASPSNKIELRANLRANGDRVTGSWEERSFNATGDGNGTLKGDELNVTISGGITGQLIVSTGAKDQLVSLKSSGTALDSVNLRLKRRSSR